MHDIEQIKVEEIHESSRHVARMRKEIIGIREDIISYYDRFNDDFFKLRENKKMLYKSQCELDDLKKELNATIYEIKEMIKDTTIIKSVEQIKIESDKKINELEKETQNLKKAVEKICTAEKLSAIQGILDTFGTMMKESRSWMEGTRDE